MKRRLWRGLAALTGAAAVIAAGLATPASAVAAGGDLVATAPDNARPAAPPSTGRLVNLIPPRVFGQLAGGDAPNTPASDSYYACIAGKTHTRLNFFRIVDREARAGRSLTAQIQVDMVTEAVDEDDGCGRREGGDRYNMRRLFDAISQAGRPPRP